MTISTLKDPLRILFIEDSQDDVSLMVRELKKSYKIIWQRVANEASLIVALDEDWDVILCDYVIPGFSVDVSLDIIRNHPKAKLLPFIVVSGYVDETVVIEYLKKGVHDFISKDKLSRLAYSIKREILVLRQLQDTNIKSEKIIQESYDRTIEAWGKALELRDYETRGHTQRVTDLALRLALYIGVPHYDFVCLYRGGLLHDIGKMGIPDAILLKRDELTKEEMNIMKMHPILAKEMLDGIPFLKPCLIIPYCHHEKWNGKGYPQGLDGDKIPFLARLFSVVDVYDALTHDRPYRASWDKSKAIAYILEERGISFDPKIVDVFVDMIGRA